MNNLNHFPFSKSELVEVPVLGASGGNGQTRISFPDQPQLRYKLLQSIEAYCVNDVSMTPTQTPVVSAAQLLGATLVMYIEDPDKAPIRNPRVPIQTQDKVGLAMGEYIKMPLNSIHRIQSYVGAASTTPVPFVRALPQFQNIYVQWEKCYIMLAAPLANTTTVSFYFNVYYSGV